MLAKKNSKKLIFLHLNCFVRETFQKTRPSKQFGFCNYLLQGPRGSRGRPTGFQGYLLVQVFQVVQVVQVVHVVQVARVAWVVRVVLVINFVNVYDLHGLNNQIIEKS